MSTAKKQAKNDDDLLDDDDLYVKDEVCAVSGRIAVCDWTPIVPGTFRLKIGALTFRADAKGRILKPKTKYQVGKLDYRTGTIFLRRAPNAKVIASYRFAL